MIIAFADWTVRGRWWPVTLRATDRPADAIVVHHAVTNTTGRTDLEQIRDVEEVIYGRRLRSRFSMFAYCYGVGTGGTGFEGRGVKYRNGANNDTKRTGFGNGNTISIVVCGNYENGVPGVPTLEPTRESIDTVVAIVRFLILSGHLVSDPEILPHNHVHATACPGDNLEGVPLAEIYHRSTSEDDMATLSTWARAAWAKAQTLGVLSSPGDRPRDAATREEVVVMLMRLHEVLERVDNADRAGVSQRLAELSAEIAAVPAGRTGPAGPRGRDGAAASVDAVIAEIKSRL